MSRDEIVNELHRPARKVFPRKSVKMVGIDDNWQSDLLSLINYAKFNSGYKFLLVVIDTFSKYLWARKLKTKTANEVAEQMEDIFKKSNRLCRHLHTDFGGEYINAKFKKLTEKYDINHFQTFSHLKAQICERVNLTIRRRLGWHFTKRGNYKWIDIIQGIIDNYNNTKHRTTGFAPNKINKSNEKYILEKVYNKNEEKKKFSKLKKPKFKIGDYVRLSKYKTHFEKSTTRNWTTEIFKIVKVNRKFPFSYILEDSNGKSIKGQVYEPELLKTKYKDTYLISKIIKKKGSKVFVSWLGFDSTHNSWVDKKELI